MKEDTDYYKLYITNRGKQIEEEKRELIFDRFYQMEQGSGIGIGLHLAREIVTLHQGTLKVVDRSGLEEATTFQLCAQLRVCSQAGGIPVYPRFSQPDNSESWDDAGNGI